MASRFAFRSSVSLNRHRRIRLRQHETFVKRDPRQIPSGGPFIELPELSGHCHAASARAAGAASAALLITGRHRCRGGNRHECCNQEQIFHNSLLLRFVEASAAHTRTKYAYVRAEPNAMGDQTRGGGVGGRSARANAVASSFANVRPLKRGIGNRSEIGQKSMTVAHETVQQLLVCDSWPHG